MLKHAGKGVPIIIAGPPAKVKHVMLTVQGHEATEDWSWVLVHLFDTTKDANTNPFHHNHVYIGTPNKMTKKVLPFTLPLVHKKVLGVI